MRIDVAWTQVHILRRFSSLDYGLEVKNRHGTSQLHNIRLLKTEFLSIPFSSLYHKVGNVGSIFGLLSDLLSLLLDRDEIEFKLVNGSSTGFSGELLEEGGGKSSWVGEGTDPVVEDLSLSGPNSEEVVSGGEVLIPVGKSLQ